MRAIIERATGAEREDWYTPQHIFDALGERFDLDPAGSPGALVPADAIYCLPTDGLVEPWHGFVWLNPPYGAVVGDWLDRLASHGNGIALVAARTDARWFQRAAGGADGMVFHAGRIAFHRGAPRHNETLFGATEAARSGTGAQFPSALLAYGSRGAAALRRSGLGPYVERKAS